MRCVVQRVTTAKVTVEGRVTGEIGLGLMVLVGVAEGDTGKDMDYCLKKVAGLRIFADGEGKMNLSVSDVQGGILAVSQFTLLGDVRHGKRPSFIEAARPEEANPMYESMAKAWREMGIPVETGVFGAHMEVSLVNDGPVTILIDSKEASLRA